MSEDAASPHASRRREQRERRQQRRRRAGVVVALLLLGVTLMAGAIVYAAREDPPPPEPVRTITLTIPEGYSRAQTAELAREAGLRGDYLKPARRRGRGLEGFLFPDTFELERRAPVSDLVGLQLRRLQDAGSPASTCATRGRRT